jgi:origin recognition complex subunit 3
VVQGRKYLDYDLEALYVFLRQHQTKGVVVAFQDGEAFESAVLGDLISLLQYVFLLLTLLSGAVFYMLTFLSSSWRDRIRFDLLFGIATSVELFQARLPKSTARQLYGAQFDVVQAGSVLDGVVKTAVASTHAALRIGPTLLRILVDRQRHHVAGIHAFVASLKYAYMCHFYADPLSVLLAGEDRLTRALLQPEHLEAVRTLGSFKAEVEAAVEARQLRHARSLIEEDEYLAAKILENGQRQKEYLLRLLRSLQLITASGLTPVGFTDLYILALAEGIDVAQSSSSRTIPLEDAVRKLGPEDFLSLTTRLLTAIETGSPELGLEGWTRDAEDLVTALTELHDEVDALIARTTKNNKSTLKSRYSAASRILRTTVVAQKVQLSRDDATLTDEDRAFTQAIDNLCALLVQHVRCEPLAEQFLHEAWTFDDPRAPYRDVFCPRPGAVLARALARPHDYLACKCCCGVEGKEDHRNVPAASVLYRLYLEAGGLVNVADLWAAYYAFVGGGEEEEEEEEEGGTEEERKALVKFYRGLAELRMMGFVRPSRRKADHVAKVKWL